MRMSCFTTGGPGKGHGTNKSPPTGRLQERSKGDITCPAVIETMAALKAALKDEKGEQQRG